MTVVGRGRPYSVESRISTAIVPRRRRWFHLPANAH